MKYILFKYKSEEAIKDGKAERPRDSKFPIDFGTRKKETIEAAAIRFMARRVFWIRNY